MNFIPLKGDCLATSVYAGGDPVGINIPATLPEVAPTEIEMNAAGGKISIPVWQQLAAMEASISVTGLSKEFLAAIKPEAFDLILNISQESIESDGTASEEHVKAFLRVIPKGIPTFDISPGELGEKQISFSVLSYKLIVDGKEYLHIDVLKGICSINGKDYMEKTRSFL